MIELLCFRLVPKRPGGEGLELAASERPKGLFGVGDGFRQDGRDDEVQFSGGERERGGNGIRNGA